jgi:hypothetical protein
MLFDTVIHYKSKSGILVEIDFALNEIFFATLILYESKSRIREASLDTCRPLGTGDPGKYPQGTPSTTIIQFFYYF